MSPKDERRGKNTGNGCAGLDRPPDPPLPQYDLPAAGDIRGDNGSRHTKIAEAGRRCRAAQQLLEPCVAPDRVKRQRPAPYLSIDSVQLSLDFSQRSAKRVKRADYGANATAGDVVHGHFALFQHFNDADVGEPLGRAGSERQPYLQASNAPGDTVYRQPKGTAPRRLKRALVGNFANCARRERQARHGASSPLLDRLEERRW